MTRPPLCIYHGSCDDGFGAALAVHLGLQGQVELFHGVHMQPPPPDEALLDRDVVIVDFSYKRAVLEEMLTKVRSLLVLDHHKTAQDDLAFLPHAQNTWDEHLRSTQSMSGYLRGAAIFDMDRSGSMLAWNYFHPGVTPPSFYEYLQDRDLWRQKLECGSEFSMALRSYPQTIEVWKTLMYAAASLIIEGGPILRYYRQRIEELKKTAVPRTLLGQSVLVCNAPFFAASEVAGELAPEDGYAACYFHNGHGWQFSLRARGSFDCSAIALQFGGGGHKSSAGFTVPTLPWLLGKPRRMQCCVCGLGCQGRQWSNRDDGYGLCSACAVTLPKEGTSPAEMENLYGKVGIHYFLPAS